MNDNVIYNEVKLFGKINNIIETENYIFFGMTCETYSNNNGKAFVSLRIYKDLYYAYKDLFFKENKIYIKGYLTSYADNNKKINTYIMVTKVANNNQELENHTPHIRYDKDGVMVWNGKRCEANECSEEEQKEMEEILSVYK